MAVRTERARPMTLRDAFERTLIEVATTRALLSLAMLSVLLYAFYYPAPYSQQESVGMRLVVVDQGRSPLGRSIVRALSASRSVRIVGMAPDMAAGEDRLLDRSADGILLLSRDLDRIVTNPAAARPGAGIALVVNAAYFTRAEAIVQTLVDTLLARVAERARTIDRRLPDPGRLVRVQPLFNTTAGYRDYIFPAVANIILQQTLLFAAARLTAERRRRNAPFNGLSAALGTWAAMILIGLLAQAFFFGFAYWVQDIPRGGNMAGLALAMPLFAAAVSALGLAIGHAVRDGDAALKLLIPTSVPLVFLAGFAWPLDQMPDWLATLAWASPATPAMHLFVRFNQMGARTAEAIGPLSVMAVLAVLYGVVALRLLSTDAAKP
ncbi:ABC transporter permease [uncultured Sphingomonas sp.]|uniref:ABC transporter permease n=1 Tax=uncultured Sphingomonas sp. TaxID=158754 RepID=UPI0025F5621A|nr:ABC transporter permease [uncultured Sphingomonas sp.]